MFQRLIRHFQKTPPRELCETWALLNHENLVNYARVCIGDFADVELVISKAMHAVMEAFYAGSVSRENLLPYARRAIRNIAASIYLKENRRVEAEALYSRSEEPPSGGCTLTEKLDLRLAIQQLPEELSKVLTLHIWERLSFTDIAATLRVSESTVRRRYQQAITLIRTQLSE